MNDKDNKMIDMLVQDKSKKYKLVIDNDSVWVVDVETDKIIHMFEDYGYEMVVELFKYLGTNAELC